MMTVLKTLLFAAVALHLSSPNSALAQDSNAVPSTALSKALAEGKNKLAIGKVKAAYADRKDILGRFIRIRFDGTTLELAGFAQSSEASKNAEELASRIVKPAKIQSHWLVEPSIANHEPYATHIGEQSGDALVKTRVLASLSAPDVRPQLQNAEIQHVVVDHGQVFIYIIADAPPAQFDLAPHITPIEGVKGLSCHILKAFHESDVYN